MSEISKKCNGCGKIFKPTKKYKDSELCSTCRKNHKNCDICGKEIFVQAKTCSNECAYELRKKSWRETCGSEHNFSKTSSSRKKFEEKMISEEGITNPAQRNDVKEKIKNTFRKKYNGINNPLGVKEIRDQIRNDKEKDGIWIPLDELSKYQIYRRNVDMITRENIKKYGPRYLKDLHLLELNENLEFKDKWTKDHIYTVYDGFKNKISPEMIGSIVNIQIITFSSNSRKHRYSHISLNTLNKRYNNFLQNENKIH